MIVIKSGFVLIKLGTLCQQRVA